ncbi:bacteriocin immunity protein [Enterococcus mediterraneensis]|uniref:bacteriocin immunity protein n=1 Tax=Enterococcus mediterraneensis TaxID=2364791 RepID=UPI000F051D83|nr:bacteriocin immunity protein [Enterococcus mediterraneensis]
MKKTSQKEIKETILSNLYDLVLDSTIKENERKILLEAKNNLEKNNYFPRVMNNLEKNLRPAAIRGELSKPVAKFYMDISTVGKFEKELGRGLASAPITFGH